MVTSELKTTTQVNDVSQESAQSNCHLKHFVQSKSFNIVFSLSLSLSLSLKLVFSIFKQKPEVLLLLLLLLPATNINTRQNIASGKTHMLTLHLFRSHSLSPFLSFSLSPSLTLTSITLFHTPTHANTHALIAPHNALAQIHIIPSLSLSLSLSLFLSFFLSHTHPISLSLQYTHISRFKFCVCSSHWA